MAIAERETPNSRATSARDSPNSSSSRRASNARIFDTCLRRAPALSSRALTPACQHSCSITSLIPDGFRCTANCRRIRSSASRSTVSTKTLPHTQWICNDSEKGDRFAALACQGKETGKVIPVIQQRPLFFPRHSALFFRVPFFVTLQFSFGHFFEATRLVDFFPQSE